MNDCLVSDIKNGIYKKIIIFSGAGVSVDAGISTYRGPDGLYTKLEEALKSENYRDSHTNRPMTNPELFFSRSYVDRVPECRKHPLILEQRKQMENAEPTSAHYFAMWLHEKGWLKRVYTQNVDGLYQKTGLPEDKVVEVHGTYKDDKTVLFGDPLALNYIESCMYVDKIWEDVDLALVMGTSLQVAPFKWFLNILPRTCHRVYVNKDDLFYDINEKDIIKGQSYKLCKKRVSMKFLWDNKKRYQKQSIITGPNVDVQEFCSCIMEV